MKSRKKFTFIFYFSDKKRFYAQENKNYKYNIIVINIHAIIELQKLQKYNGIIFLLKFIINIRKNLS